jgi:hypothetical protein
MKVALRVGIAAMWQHEEYQKVIDISGIKVSSIVVRPPVVERDRDGGSYDVYSAEYYFALGKKLPVSFDCTPSFETADAILIGIDYPIDLFRKHESSKIGSGIINLIYNSYSANNVIIIGQLNKNASGGLKLHVDDAEDSQEYQFKKIDIGDVVKSIKSYLFDIHTVANFVDDLILEAFDALVQITNVTPSLLKDNIYCRECCFLTANYPIILTLIKNKVFLKDYIECMRDIKTISKSLHYHLTRDQYTFFRSLLDGSLGKNHIGPISDYFCGDPFKDIDKFDTKDQNVNSFLKCGSNNRVWSNYKKPNFDRLRNTNFGTQVSYSE